MNENANYVVKMAMVSKLEGKHCWKNDKQISEEEKTLVCAREEPRKEEREGGRKEGRKVEEDVIATAGLWFWFFLLDVVALK